MTIIIRQNGTRYDLKEFGIRTKDFVVSSPSPRHTTEEIDGRHGVVDMGTTYDVRTITCSFRMSAYDLSDYPLMRDEVFALFQSTEAFYLIDSRIPFKRWFVKVASSFEPSQAYTFGDFTVQFVSFFPFAESIGTTQDIQENGINADDELWGFGMGLIEEMGDVEYVPTRWYHIGFKKWSEI
jgi:phage-related protein